MAKGKISEVTAAKKYRAQEKQRRRVKRDKQHALAFFTALASL